MSKVARIIVIIIIFVFSMGIYAVANYVNTAKTNITAVCNDNTKDLFVSFYDEYWDFYHYYDYELCSQKSKGDILFTSDFKAINKDLEYTSYGFSPLVICFKNSESLNNYLKSNNSKGFLISNNSDKIENDYKDDISCDFLNIINAVSGSKNWSYFGGKNHKITLYCPCRNTVEGELFYNFLLITINEGKYPSDANLEEVSKKADAFYNSPNVIQVNVLSKINKLADAISEDDIYCIFEADLIKNAKEIEQICVTYPLTTVSKHIYVQINNEMIKENIVKNVFDNNHHLEEFLTSKWYYRTSVFSDWEYLRRRNKNVNVNNGYNDYELYK